MACAPCEAKRKQMEEQARIRENLRYAPRPVTNQQPVQQQNNQPASKKFQSPTILPPIQ